MNITIIGWYGTETIGDRAILAGIINLFSDSFGKLNINLGSLYPFITKRTIFEDFDLYGSSVELNPSIELFDSRNNTELKAAIYNCDLLVVGGGPLMDLSELLMVEFAVKIAKKYSVKSMIAGCGIGPLFQAKYQKCVVRIVKNTDLVVLRDEQSKMNLMSLLRIHKYTLDKPLHVSLDPAVHCANEFRKNNFKNHCEKSISVSLRSFPEEYSLDQTTASVNLRIEAICREVFNKFDDYIIKLIPMCYHHLGVDDRLFFLELKQRLGRSNIEIQYKPLTLEESMRQFVSSEYCIGMRFHSVVLQTLLNGKNLVLDYTGGSSGKISGFLNDVTAGAGIGGKIVDLQSSNSESIIIEQLNNPIKLNFLGLENKSKILVDQAVELFN
ncbi:polysaccharide pyruvyl transferase family protein [Amylibacter sp.]|nr:polysaccharide pyruvyl transferase family protein [Amylibacter sp.]